MKATMKINNNKKKKEKKIKRGKVRFPMVSVESLSELPALLHRLPGFEADTGRQDGKWKIFESAHLAAWSSRLPKYSNQNQVA